MKVKPKTKARNSPPAFLKVIKQALVFDTRSIFLIAITLTVPLTYFLTTWFLAPDKLRAPLASWAHKQGYFSAINNGGIPKTLLLAPLKIIKMDGNQEIPKINIDIKFKHLQKIRKQKAARLGEKGYLSSQPKYYVPAAIQYENRTIQVKSRLKGDEGDHFQGDKSSFRIHVKKEAQIFGVGLNY